MSTLIFVGLSLVLVCLGFALGLWWTGRRRGRALVWPPGFVVVDCETTGLDARAHSLLSIGAVVPATGAEFYGECRAWPGAMVDGEALEVNGESLERVWDADIQSESALVQEFVRWAQAQGLKVVGGKNPSFDQGFLKAAWKRAAMAEKWPLSHRTVDLHSLAWGWALRHRPEAMEREGIRSDDLYVMMGLEREPKPHHALVGAQFEAEAFRHLLGEREGRRS